MSAEFSARFCFSGSRDLPQNLQRKGRRAAAVSVDCGRRHSSRDGRRGGERGEELDALEELDGDEIRFIIKALDGETKVKHLKVG